MEELVATEEKEGIPFVTTIDLLFLSPRQVYMNANMSCNEK